MARLEIRVDPGIQEGEIEVVVDPKVARGEVLMVVPVEPGEFLDKIACVRGEDGRWWRILARIVRLGPSEAGGKVDRG